jgi:lipoprotein-anchoring transpeptidase ErfK/SrfK
MNDYKIVVRVREQEADLYQNFNILQTFKISTALNGMGCEQGSHKTPHGTLRIGQKIGDGAAIGSVFKNRVQTGEVWSQEPSNSLSYSTVDLVLTRILWLEGCETHNLNTKDRAIYFHGTNQEHLLGTACSHGCIRMSNEDIIFLFDTVPEGTIVEIIE